VKKRPMLLSYRLRISLTIALFAIIPFSILSAIYFSTEKTKWEQTALTQYSQILDLSKSQLDRGIQELENKILFVKNDTTIRNYLNRIQKLTLSEELEFITELREAASAVSVDSEKLTVRWYSQYSKHAYGEYCYRMEDLQTLHRGSDADLQAIFDLESNEILTCVHNFAADPDRHRVYVYTKVSNESGPEHILEMSIPVAEMLYIDQGELSEDYVLGVQLPLEEQTQMIVLHGDPAQAQQRLEKYYQTGSCRGYYPLEAELSEWPGSRITCLLEDDFVSKQILGTVIGIAGIFVLLLVVVLVCSYVVARLLTGKVVQFVERVSLELRNSTVQGDEPADSDFSDIEQRVRELAYCSREYGKQLEAYEMEKKKMELELLQLRFSPHFLYNTLGSIRYQVKDQRIRESIDSLIAYYRIVLSKGSLVISIESEIQMIKEYLNLQTFAFDLKNVEFVYEIDDAVKPYSIIKHLLQPIVENALEHGIRGKDTGAVLTIRARLCDDNVVFEVEDTGIGMTQEQIDRVMAQPCGEQQIGGYGVYNVIQRIKTYYGPEYGVQYTSKPGKGTRVTITIPQKTNAQSALQEEKYRISQNTIAEGKAYERTDS